MGSGSAGGFPADLVAAGMVGAFARLGIGLQAEAQALQQAADQLLAGGEAAFRQRGGQTTLALAHPPQGGLGIAADRWFDQLVQGRQNPRLGLGRWLAAAARSPNPRAEHHGASTQVCQAATNRAARNPGCQRNRNHPAAASSTRLTGREQPAPSLVQNRLQRLEASLDGSDVDHPLRIGAPAETSRPISDSLVAFLPPARFFSSDSVALAQALSALRCTRQRIPAMLSIKAAIAYALCRET